MSQPAATHQELDWNPEDPHNSTSHEHHVVSWQMLLLVLIALLACTVLTVGIYNFETWVEHAFGIHIPKWVNVFGAMSIATIKATLVCAYFMQLRYDKALNTFALLFCLLGVGLFLTFTMIDLNSRDTIYKFKAEEEVVGGTGSGLDTPARDERFSSRVSPYIATGRLGIVEFRRQQAIENYFDTEDGAHYAHDPAYEGNPEKAFWHHYYSTHGDHPHHHPGDTENYFAQLGFDHSTERSTANRSIPRHGVTPGLFDEVEPDGHAGSHDAAHNTDHSEGHAEEPDHAADH